MRGKAASSPISTSNTSLDDWYMPGPGSRSAMVNSAMTKVEEFVMIMLEVLWYWKLET
jgi:hypothetical protein